LAYTNSPQISTYKTEEVLFDGADMFRSGDTSVERDLQIVNMFYDRISQENKTKSLLVKKRPGLAATTYSFSKVAAANPVRGSFYDATQNAFYWVVLDKVYVVNPDVGTSIRTVTTLTTTTGYVGFCSFLKSDNTRYVCITDGIEMWIDNYATTTCTEVTDVDFPTPHEPYPVYIDGYLLVIKKNSGDFYNSDLDDPFAWTSDNFLSAEIHSDYALRLFKVKNYLVVLGNGSIEYFWNAGNTSGSPFSRNDSPTRNLGYVTGGVQIEDTVYFVGQDNNKNLAVYALNSFKADRISNPVVDRTLQTRASTNNVKAPVTLGVDGHSISIDGHTFYILVTPQTTWAYDVDDKFWYEWKNSDNTGLKIEAVWGMYNGAVYCAITGQSTFSIFSTNVYQDFGSNFTCRYTTEHLQFGTGNWKVANKLYLSASKHLNTGTSNVLVSWSYDDWSSGGFVGTRNINVFSNSPYFTRLGRFRNASFRFEYADNYPFFMNSFYLTMNVQGV
jgi:hypothetical protein